MKEIKIILKLPDFQLIFREIKQFLINKKLELILLIIILTILLLWNFDNNKIIIYAMLSSAFLLYVWQSGFIRAGLKYLKINKLNFKKKKLEIVLLFIILILLAVWQFKIESIILLTLFLSFLLFKWDSRIIAFLALVSLMSCPILLILEREDSAEQMAIYAYYFLVITVILQIVEYWKESREKKN